MEERGRAAHFPDHLFYCSLATASILDGILRDSPTQNPLAPQEIPRHKTIPRLAD